MRRAGAATILALGLLPRAALAEEPSKAACVAASENAEDLQRAGKLREASARLAVCIATSCPAPVRADCAERMADVRKAIPTIVFEARDGAGNDISAVRVTFDGQLLADRLDGTALAVDPGEHTFAFVAAGAPPVEKRLIIREADKGRLEKIVLGPATPTSTTPTPTPTSTPTPTPTSTPTPTPTSTPTHSGSSQRTTGLIVGGTGVAGLILGGAFGLMAKSTYDHALKDECGGAAGGCTPAGAQDGKTANTQATVSTVAFTAGAVLCAGGALLYFTAPRDSVTVAPAVGAGEAGLVVRGVW